MKVEIRKQRNGGYQVYAWVNRQWVLKGSVETLLEARALANAIRFGLVS